MSNLSFGEKRLRLNLENKKPGNVFFIQSLTASILNALEDFKNDPRNQDPEQIRLICIAQTEYETAALLAEKAVTDGTEAEKNLVSFGKYLLSNERKESLQYPEGVRGIANLKEVYDSDIKNWQDSQ
ncbi:hypothetical protein SAMN05421786_11513 [Chryseobacterium ureilyticum]|uniref:Uncharacterized protein n=1 Tax=Chryseobacterium ureilyticum TaxID=373668 RepID=A0A1N7QRU3_9FLAO|nr:hypothetical protein [Chryseobacterium ureilyticum]SIT25484.1 hypothetical protein SAMN05421786_11513 [Chryseobacterium ureilyticum]